MTPRDFARLVLASIAAHRLRSGLTALGIAIGIAAVVLLTSLGAGLREFVLAEFSQFGTRIVAINPGRTMTHGMPVGMFGSSRPITIEDALALETTPGVIGVVPYSGGNAEVEGHGRTRRTMVHGVGPAMPAVFRMEVQSGLFLPTGDPRSPRAFAVLGSKLRRELFGDAPVLGARVRVGSERYRIIGVLAPKGEMLGLDMDDGIFIPTARAQALFNREGLMEIDVIYGEKTPAHEVLAAVKRMMIARHGHEDFTLTTQEQMVEVMGNILNVLTFAVGALGGISLVVGAVGVLTIMTIAVRERAGEIGLFRALGASHGQILTLFLAEAILLATAGGAAGLILGAGGAALLHALVPSVPVETPWSYAVLALVVACGVGILAGILPARRAARLDPVEALRAE